jgi:hypothetical protein
MCHIVSSLLMKAARSPLEAIAHATKTTPTTKAK